MQPKYIGFMVFVWIIGLFLASTYEGHTSTTGTVTGGSTTTIVDTVNLTQDDDYWNGAAFCITETTDDGEPLLAIGTVTDYVKDTHTLTITTEDGELHSPVEAGDTYIVGEWAGVSGIRDLRMLTNLKNVMNTTTAAGNTSFSLFNTQYLGALWNVISWNSFTFMDTSPWDMVKWIVLFPLSIMCIFAIGYMFVTLMMSFITG